MSALKLWLRARRVAKLRRAADEIALVVFFDELRRSAR